jgi:hypothetical protein
MQRRVREPVVSADVGIEAAVTVGENIESRHFLIT